MYVKFDHHFLFHSNFVNIKWSEKSAEWKKYNMQQTYMFGNLHNFQVLTLEKHILAILSFLKCIWLNLSKKKKNVSKFPPKFG